jgi:hypothetical protein
MGISLAGVRFSTIEQVKAIEVATGQAHRPVYGVDGDYISKPNVQDVVALAYDLMNGANPARYPSFF